MCIYIRNIYSVRNKTSNMAIILATLKSAMKKYRVNNSETKTYFYIKFLCSLLIHLPNRIKKYNEINLVTMLRIVKFTELELANFDLQFHI